MAVDAAGYSYKIGSLSGTLDFDPAGTRPGDSDILASAGNRDIFVAKYAPDDTLVWAVRMSGAGGGLGGDSADIFLVKLISAGSLAWAETFGGDYNDIAVDQLPPLRG